MERPLVTISAMIFNPKGEILLFKSSKWGGRYVLPRGYVKYGEKLEQTVVREVEEETELKIYDLRLIRTCESINNREYYLPGKHFICFQYICKTKSLDFKLNREGKDPKWIKPNDALNENLESITRETIGYYCFAIE